MKCDPILIGGKIVWGVPSVILPIYDERVPLFGAKLRFRFRHNEFARVFIKTPDGIQQWYLEDLENCWALYSKTGENKRL